MAEDFLAERRHSLEEKFFHSRETQLLDRLKKEHEQQATRDELKDATGIDDDALLDEIASLGIKAETLICLSLVPLVQVAWADRQMRPDERKAVLAAADTSGLRPGSAPYDLLESWLTNPPNDDLLKAWVDYIKTLASKMEPRELAKLKTDILARARAVAESAGGYFGLGKISKAEHDVLARIEAAFP